MISSGGQSRARRVLSSGQAKLAAVAVASEVEVEVQDAALERTLEAALVRHLPLLVHDLERDVLRSLRCDKTSPTVTPLPAKVPPQYPIPTYRFRRTVRKAEGLGVSPLGRSR